jgi:hypothetical protein
MIASGYRGAWWLALGLLVAFADRATGQEAHAPAIVTPPAAVEAGAKPDAPPREKSIYIPYEKLRHVFEKQGRGVFLPYEEFDQLWKAAREHAKPAVDEKPPFGALITEIENEATVEKDVVRVKAKVTIEVLAEGWSEVPLRLADAAITRATIGDRPARIVGGPGEDYRLLVEKKGKTAESIELELHYAKAITRMPGQNSVSFQSPQAPVSRWKVTIPQAGVKVNLHPLLAATEAPAADDQPEDAAEQTVVLAFVGAAPLVRIDWTPKAEGATGLEALASVQAEQQVWIVEGVTRTRATLNYAISRAELPQLTIEVPADQKVVNVFDDNVRQWSVDEADGAQRIAVQLFEPAKSQQRVTVELEKFAGEEARASLGVPVVKALNVGRQQGVVVVNVAAGLRAETTKTSGLMQVDRSELPEHMRASEGAFAYRYASVPFELTLDVEKVQPRVLADMLIEAYLEPERLTFDATALFSIERSGVFRLEMDIPEGYQVRQVRGRALPATSPDQPAAAAAEVDNHHLEGEKKTRLIVNLSKKAMGRVGLAVELTRDLSERDDLAQPGKSVQLTVALPSVPAEAVERSVGRLLIYAPESLRVNPAAVSGLGDLTFEKALEGFGPSRERKPGDGRAAFAYSFTDEPTELKLAVERRQPHVTIEQWLVVRIESGVVRYASTLNYEVRYSGVKSLRVDVPKALAEQIKPPAGISHRPIEPQPDDVDESDVAWLLTGESEFLGNGSIELTWEKKLEKLDVGKSVKIDVPHLKPRGVDRAWGQVVVTKAEALDVGTPAEPVGLRPIDPQLDLRRAVAGAARAFEFHDDWSLPVTITQYELEDIKRTSIERGVVRMVITPAGELAVQALYRMRSARQRLELNLDQRAEFAAGPLRINGKSVSLERGKPGQYFVPLVEPDPDEPFLVELRYTTPDDGKRLQLPTFPQDPAVLKVYLCVYLPADRVLLGTRGHWTDEFRWWLDDTLVWQPVPRTAAGNSAEDLLRWAAEGVNVAGGAAESFPTDGTLYVYSTLAPAAPPQGDLRLYAMQKDWLHALVFGLAVLGGVLLLPAGLASRATAVGMVIVLIILGGVFMPTFSMQILDGYFLSAVFVVLVLWVVWYFVRTRPMLLAERAAAPAPPAPPAAPPVAGPPAKPLGGVVAGIDLTKRADTGPAPVDDETEPNTGSEGGKSHE